MKDDFVSTVTHELRTPLTSIRAFTQILLEHPDVQPEQRTRFLGIITKETVRLSRLINQVLDLSKIESGRAQWQETRVDLKEVLSDSIAGMGQVFEESAIRVEVRMPDEVPRVLGDVDRIIQVVLNLLSNAAKFCASGRGQIGVALYEEGACLRVDVSDNGPGVSSADQALIFDKFRQAGDTLINKPQGTGLGLPISRHIVEHHGGRLWVESGPGGGACFSFTLPFHGRLVAEAA
jgi:signal transduction histidine kinase